MAPLKLWPRPEASASEAQKIAGDQARDMRDWAAASDAYQRYLKASPEDAGIWVQYAHVLKEQNLLIEAEAAYRKATTMMPGDADSRLHLAHLLKRLERPKQAAAMFREIMEIAPTVETLTELEGLGFGSVAQALLRASSVETTKNGRYIELKDLFQYLSLHTTVTGITRVTLGLVNYILEDLDEAEAATYQFAHQYGDGEGLLLIPKPQMRRVVRLAMSAAPDLAAMQSLISEIRATSQIIRLEKGHLYLIVGAFWEFVANPSWLNGMKQRGVAIGAYIYDIIPITHAHYCMAALTDAFTAAFSETARLLDFALTISEFVAKQVTDYVAHHGIAPFPTIAVPLAHELRFEAERAKRSLPATSRLDDLDDVPFVLCVCTIEARKNHIYLFYIWQRMIEAGLDVPDLVFVGRPGWRIQDLMDQIDASRNLGGRLHIMHGLSDQELEALYDRCLFTVFPSFVEGWGLPVGESLARGKVCVASSTTSIPEVGGDFVLYVDPFNLESGYKVISGLVSNRASLAGLEAKLRTSFTARTWKDVGQDFFIKVDKVTADLGRRQAEQLPYAPTLMSGEMLSTANMGNVGALGAVFVANPERLAFADGWRGVETTGTWMRDQPATLRLQTGCETGQKLALLLHVGTSPWVGPQNTLRISASSSRQKRREQQQQPAYARPMREDANFWIRLAGEVGEAGFLVIRFRIEGPVEVTGSSKLGEEQHTPVALRLHAVGYALPGHIEARLNLLEQALLPPD